MAKHTKKSTRKFEKKNHKEDIAKQRKTLKKVKLKQQLIVKKKVKDALKAENANGEDGEAGIDESKEDPLQKMTVDAFFQGGFEMPEKLAKKSVKSKAKIELGKRKRVVAEEEEDDDSSSVESFEEAPVMSDSGDGEEEGDREMDMEALKEKDPEFYKHLQENDPDLLDFNEDADLSEVDELSDDEEEQPKKKRKKSKKADADNEVQATDGTEVTKAMVAKWRKAMTEGHSLRAMRQVVLAFRAAAHVNEDDGKTYKYTISNPDVYHDLLVLTLTNITDVLNHHLPVQETASGRVRVPTNGKKFKTLTALLKSHTSSVHHLLTTLSDASTLKITLQALTPLLPYLLSFKKILKNVVKTVVGVWSDASSNEATRITAFLVIRRLVVIGDPGIREAVLKTVYQGLLVGGRGTSIHSIQGINLMKNSAAELWGIDQAVGYTTGFTFIRQLAIHLRGSITNNAKESYKTVYNWQYVHSLDFWSSVLSEHCSPLKEAAAGKASEFRSLIYPTVQVTLGAMRLIPTATYFPLRFQLTRSLLRLSRATGTYIPLASALLEVLSSAEMKKVPKPSTLKGLDFSINYKCQKSYLRSRVYQDGVGEQVVELLSEFIVLWSTSIAFPELALPVIVMLKRWLKEVQHKSTGNKNSKVNGMIVTLAQKLDANAKWIEERRAKVDFAPNNRAGVTGFLKGFEWEKTPLGAFVAGQRKQREEKRKLLEAARREDERKKKKEREDAMKGSDVEVDDASEEEEEKEDDEEEEHSEGEVAVGEDDSDDESA